MSINAASLELQARADRGMALSAREFSVIVKMPYGRVMQLFSHPSFPAVGKTVTLPDYEWWLKVAQVVYFIEAEGLGFIKIGRSTLPLDRRVAAMQTGCPGVLKVLATTPGDHRLEGLLHLQFKSLHFRGEWFRAGAELLEFIERVKAGKIPNYTALQQQ